MTDELLGEREPLSIWRRTYETARFELLKCDRRREGGRLSRESSKNRDGLPLVVPIWDKN